ncbi:MAG: peptidylprolyl isomerase [Gemmatimonadota bacterium]
MQRAQGRGDARRALVLIGAALLVGYGCARATIDRLPSPDGVTAPETFRVAFETTKGTFIAEAHRAWSPAAVDRFYDLVRRSYYDSVPIHRVVPGFVAQFGLTGDSAVDTAWRGHGVPDEPTVVSNTAGRIAFARGGPASRVTQLYVNLADNPRLDTLATSGITGYPPIAEVVEGMDVVLSFEGRHANATLPFQDSLRLRGTAWLDARFPGLDYILRASLVR